MARLAILLNVVNDLVRGFSYCRVSSKERLELPVNKVREPFVLLRRLRMAARKYHSGLVPEKRKVVRLLDMLTPFFGLRHLRMYVRRA